MFTLQIVVIHNKFGYAFQNYLVVFTLQIVVIHNITNSFNCCVYLTNCGHTQLNWKQPSATTVVFTLQIVVIHNHFLTLEVCLAVVFTLQIVVIHNPAASGNHPWLLCLPYKLWLYTTIQEFILCLPYHNFILSKVIAESHFFIIPQIII